MISINEKSEEWNGDERKGYNRKKQVSNTKIQQYVCITVGGRLREI